MEYAKTRISHLGFVQTYLGAISARILPAQSRYNLVWRAGKCTYPFHTARNTQGKNSRRGRPLLVFINKFYNNALHTHFRGDYLIKFMLRSTFEYGCKVRRCCVTNYAACNGIMANML